MGKRKPIIEDTDEPRTLPDSYESENVGIERPLTEQEADDFVNQFLALD
jgi:hypothetical protein